MFGLRHPKSCLACALLLFVMVASAATQTPAWPRQAVHFILPFGPGAGVDITARLLADKLPAKWGHPVVVENRPGGDAIVAIKAVLEAHDEHVLLFAPASAFTAHPYLHDEVPYDPNDLVPIARVTNTIIGLAVPASLKINTIEEYASVTGANDLLFASFLKTEKLKWQRCHTRIRSKQSMISLKVASTLTSLPSQSSGRTGPDQSASGREPAGHPHRARNRFQVVDDRWPHGPIRFAGHVAYHARADRGRYFRDRLGPNNCSPSHRHRAGRKPWHAGGIRDRDCRSARDRGGNWKDPRHQTGGPSVRL
jgi:hypothetical protein